MQALLDAGGPVDAINKTLWTPLHHAARTGHPRVCPHVRASSRPMPSPRAPRSARHRRLTLCTDSASDTALRLTGWAVQENTFI